MPPENAPSQRIAVPVVVLASLGLHLLVLALPLGLPLPEKAAPNDALTLVSLPPPRTETLAEIPVPTVPAEPEESETSQPPSPTPIPDSPRRPETAADTEPADATVLQRQTMSAARRIARRENAEDPAPEHFAPVPRLPSRPGALNARLGTVTPRIDRSVRADGETNARIVMADGQVVCAHRRAARIEEVFNPWMSSAVTMMRNCGRERPDGDAASNDPWQRPLVVRINKKD